MKTAAAAAAAAITCHVSNLHPRIFAFGLESLSLPFEET